MNGVFTNVKESWTSVFPGVERGSSLSLLSCLPRISCSVATHVSRPDKKSPTNFAQYRPSDIFNTLDLSPESLASCARTTTLSTRRASGQSGLTRPCTASIRTLRTLNHTICYGNHRHLLRHDQHEYTSIRQLDTGHSPQLRVFPRGADSGYGRGRQDKGVTSVMTMRVNHVLIWMIFEVGHQLKSGDTSLCDRERESRDKDDEEETAPPKYL